MAALRFLGLIDTNGVSSARFNQLVLLKCIQKKDLLKQITTDSYGYLFNVNEPFDLQSSTYSQLEEQFQKNFELTDSVNRKCVKFFVSMAADAGILLSPFITRRLRTLPDGTGTKLPVKRKGLRSKIDTKN